MLDDWESQFASSLARTKQALFGYEKYPWSEMSSEAGAVLFNTSLKHLDHPDLPCAPPTHVQEDSASVDV